MVSVLKINLDDQSEDYEFNESILCILYTSVYSYQSMSQLSVKFLSLLLSSRCIEFKLGTCCPLWPHKCVENLKANCKLCKLGTGTCKTEEKKINYAILKYV